MYSTELRQKLADGRLSAYGHLYADVPAQTLRYQKAIDAFEARYGKDRDLLLFSVPGRSELLGNHTDHNHGMVMAGAIDRDIIAVVSLNGTNTIHLKSEGFDEDVICLEEIDQPEHFKHYTSAALIAGVCHAFAERGIMLQGFDAYTTTEVQKGSGISSSAAFEVMCGNILNHLFAKGQMSPETLAKMAQYAENVYFGKPCGLMDQMACAVGGFVQIDFANPQNPIVTPITFSLSDAGYSLCIVNTGGNHANLNDDYASVPAEMKAVAKALGCTVLRETTEANVLAMAATLRETLGDRAILRALHFFRENERVAHGAEALQKGDVDTFLSQVMASGASSFTYLQNVYTTQNVEEQGLSLALCVTAGVLKQKQAAYRVHGGGFAGTIQAFVRHEDVDVYKAEMDRIFGQGATMELSIRPLGAVQIVL